MWEKSVVDFFYLLLAVAFCVCNSFLFKYGGTRENLENEALDVALLFKIYN